MKRALAFLLAFLLAAGSVCFTDLPFSLQTHAIASSGKCGENVWWIFDSVSGTVTIGGTGPMTNYGSSGDSPWDGNRRIKTVIIENGVTSIGYEAFSSCSELTGVTIPDSVSSIGARAFQYCYSLSDIRIPDGVTQIMPDTFFCCLRLASLTIPDSVTIIEFCAFDTCQSLTDVTIPDSVTSIGNCAFANCTSLRSVSIGSGVRSIGRDAFKGCWELREIAIGDNVTRIGSGILDDTAYYSDSSNWTDGVLYLDAYLLKARSAVSAKDAVAPGTRLIADDSFSDCTALTAITLPDSLESIGYEAFNGCTNLADITVADRVTYIGEFAFENTAFYADAQNWTDDLLFLRHYLLTTRETDIQDRVLPDQTTLIANNAFNNCESLTSITFPRSLTHIGNYSFYGCRHLTDFTLPDSVTSIGEAAFEYCSSLTVVEIPNSVTTIGQGAFSGCTQLKTIWIPDSVSCIEDHTFSVCVSLTDVVFPDSVRSIGYWAFWACHSLTNVRIPDSVTSIAESAFEYCEKLSDVRIPDGTAHIGINAFKAVDSVFYDGSAQGSPWGAVHRYRTTNVVQTTCAEQGYALYKCTECDSVCQRDFTDTVDHTLTAVAAQPASKTHPGVRAHYMCSVCGKLFSNADGAREFTEADLILPRIKAVRCEVIETPKTDYAYKEKPSVSGIKLRVTYSDDTTETVDDPAAMRFDGLDTGKPVKEKNVTVTYENVSAQYSIRVRYAWWQQLIRIFLLGFLWY